MIYIEPATYILDLIRVMRQQYPNLRLRILFITTSVSQPWEKRPDEVDSILLSEGRFAALKQLISEIRDGDSDWLHLAGWGHPLLMFALLAGIFFGKRISMESDTQLSLEQRGWKEWIKEYLYPRLFSQVDRFLPGGTRQRRFFLHYGVPEEKICIAQMTVNVAKVSELTAELKKCRDEIRASIGLRRDSTVFIFVGRLEAYKGIGLLLEAFHDIDNQDIQLLIVGDGSHRGVVEEAAGSDERICYVGRKDFYGVVEAFSISDVAVIPSSFEPWGLVVNEAMAAGLPVIASDCVGCIDDLVIQNKTGIVFHSGDLQALITAMKEMNENKSFQTYLGINATQLIQQWNLQTECTIIFGVWKLAV